MKKNNKRNGATIRRIIGGLTAGLVIMSVLAVCIEHREITDTKG